MVTRSGFLSLPSERTLRNYSHWCTTKNGVNFEFLQQIKISDQEGIKIDDHAETIHFVVG